MILKIERGRAQGSVNAPTSKSMAHRLLISAAMCKGQKSVIHGVEPCEDILATIDCLRELGCEIEYDGKVASVTGVDFSASKPTSPLNCRESGSTLRFLIPIAWLSGNEVRLVGSERLLERSQSVYEQIAGNYGLTFKRDKDGITVKGPLSAGEYFIDGNISSQFITGMLLALSTLSGDSRIIINTRLESEPYVNMTMAAMAEFGVRVYREEEACFFLFGGQEYRSGEKTVEGDWSNGAFIDALGLLGGEVNQLGLRADSLQGDKIYRELFDKLDKGFSEIDISDCPDLGPILFTVAAARNGARFIGTRRLRDKESDRARAMRLELSKFGAELTVEENSVTVAPKRLHAPTERLCGHNDHRIVMSLAVLSTLFGGEIEGCEAVRKSYPQFFENINRLGILTYEVN